MRYHVGLQTSAGSKSLSNDSSHKTREVKVANGLRGKRGEHSQQQNIIKTFGCKIYSNHVVYPLVVIQFTGYSPFFQFRFIYLHPWHPRQPILLKTGVRGNCRKSTISATILSKHLEYRVFVVAFFIAAERFFAQCAQLFFHFSHDGRTLPG